MLQYIGARYVPIFYQNSQDPTSTDWELNVTYEPMTWVSLPNGHMYISKKEVPANIGSPANNGEYWLEAGQYNAYIQQLQDQIDDINDGSVPGSIQNQINDMNDGSVSGSLQNQINDMNDGSVSGSLQDQINDMNDANLTGSLQNQIRNIVTKRFVFLGDSYNTGYPSHDVNWTQFTAQMLGISGTNYYNFAEDASGIIRPGSYGHTYQQKFDLEKTSIVSPETITDVVITLAYNDITAFLGGASDTQFITGATNLINDISVFCPNAKIHMGIIGGAIYYSDYPTFYNRIVNDLNNVKGFSWLKNCEYVFANKELLLSDMHPTLDGHKTLANAMFSCIMNGSCNVAYFNKETALTPVSGITLTDNNCFISTVDNGNCDVYFKPGVTINFTAPINIIPAWYNNKIGTIDGDLLNDYRISGGTRYVKRFQCLTDINGSAHYVDIVVERKNVYIASSTAINGVSSVLIFNSEVSRINTLDI